MEDGTAPLESEVTPDAELQESPDAGQAEAETPPAFTSVDDIFNTEGDFTGTIPRDILNNLKAEMGQKKGLQRQIAEYKQYVQDFDSRVESAALQRAQELYKHQVLGTGLEYKEEDDPDAPMTRGEWLQWQREQQEQAQQMAAKAAQAQIDNQCADFVEKKKSEYPDANWQTALFDVLTDDSLYTQAEREEAITARLRESQAEFSNRISDLDKLPQSVKDEIIKQYKAGKLTTAQVNQMAPASGQRVSDAQPVLSERGRRGLPEDFGREVARDWEDFKAAMNSGG